MAKKYLSLDRLTEYDALIKAKIDEGDVSAKTYADSGDTATLDTAKAYADNAANTVKDDLLNGAGEAYDTLKELGNLIDENVDAIEALETVATGKADKDHTHDIYETKENAQIRYDAITNAKADWNQNDEAALDYIKNRPFYDGVSKQVVEVDGNSLENQTLTFTNGYIGEFLLQLFGIYDVGFGEVGTKYCVVWDGVEYDCVCFANGDGFPAMGGIENGCPFMFVYHDWWIMRAYSYDLDGNQETGTTTHTISVYVKSESVVKIPEKYLPEVYASKEYVDEFINNSVADWNQNDETAIDYIKNRPFYTISSDGSNAIVENVNFSIVEEYGYDGFPTNFILEEAKIYEVVINDVSYTCEGKRLDAHICLGDYSLSWGESKNDEEPFLIEYYPSDYDTACCFTAIDIGEYTVSIYESGGASGETVVKIPEKYLPDTVATVTYVDEQIALIPTPDVSGQINAHNEDTNAHADIRTAIDTLGSEVDGKLSGKADSAHNHVIDDITNLQSAFYGVWQQTTAREIDEALDAGKVVFMKAGGALIPLSYIPDRSTTSYYEFRAAEPAAMTDYDNPFGYATRLYRILRDPNDLDTLIYDVSFPGNVTFSIPGHKHTAREIDDGILSSDRLPTVPVTKGGTGATTAEAARTNLDVYSKAEVDSALTNKSDTSHSHNDLYYTEAEIDEQLLVFNDRIIATEENTITDVINIFTPADAGKFLCVAEDGSIKAVAFTDVSEVGA